MLIDPKIIYLGHVFDGLQILFNILMTCMIVFGGGLIIIMMCMWINGDLISGRMRAWLVVFLAVSVLSGIGMIVVPDQKTYYGMVAATYVTEDNIEVIKGRGKELVDYIFEKIQSGNE